MEMDYLFDKTHTCPICDVTFKAKVVRTGKAKLHSVDLDLRPVYQPIDSLKYDAILCSTCGYAALTRYFNQMTTRQAKLIKEKISVQYNVAEVKLDEYSYEEAIRRHKLALLSAMVSQCKMSEIAYICLKIAWLYRGQGDQISGDNAEQLAEKETAKKFEQEYILKAYDGFQKAIAQESSYPMCGMDEITLYYLIAELARQTGHNDEAIRMISKVLVSRGANDRLKEKARKVKELISGSKPE